jgi:hypothetical protein
MGTSGVLFTTDTLHPGEVTVMRVDRNRTSNMEGDVWQTVYMHSDIVYNDRHPLRAEDMCSACTKTYDNSQADINRLVQKLVGFVIKGR